MRPRALYPNCRFSDKGDMCPAAYDVNNQCPQADLDFCPTNVKAMSPGCANSDPFGITATQLGGFDQFIDVNKVEAMFLDSAGTPIGEADASACVDGDLQTTCSVETTHAPTGLRVTTGIDVPVLVRAVALYPADGYQVRPCILTCRGDVPFPVLILALTLARTCLLVSAVLACVCMCIACTAAVFPLRVDDVCLVAARPRSSATLSYGSRRLSTTAPRR